MYRFFAITLSLLATDARAVCLPTKSEAVLKKICQNVAKVDKSDLEKKFETNRDLLVYDDCGLSAAILYEPDHPQKLLVHPLRPFIVTDKKLRFAEVPQPLTENPFKLIAKKLNTASSIKLAGYKTSLGLYIYTRDYWAEKCTTRDGKSVIAATAQTRAESGGYVGSNVTGFSFETLNLVEVKSLLATRNSPVKRKAEFLALSARLIELSSRNVSLALGLQEPKVREILKDRLNDRDQYLRFEAATKKSSSWTAASVVGFLQSDFEHALAMASLPAEPPHREK